MPQLLLKLSFYNVPAGVSMACYIVLAILLIHTGTDVQAESGYDVVGDPRSCLEDNKNLKQFDILPGAGWDNLRNEDGGSVFGFSFSTCKTTRDGRFLIPDDIEVVPQRYSKVNTFSEIFSHFTEYTSVNAHSINANGRYSKGNNSISGTFSFDHQRSKGHQVRDRSVTTRVQLRYVRYTAKVKPNAKLHPDFKAKLTDIANSLGQNGSDMATFKSQLLVRDFGTHIVRSLDAGAVLVQEDQISSDYTKRLSETKITAGASLSFFYKFAFGLGYAGTFKKSNAEEYEKERSSSVVTTYGGKQFKAFNFSANEWAEAIDDNMVAVDREGIPLQYLITPANIPELQPDQVHRLYHSVKDAVNLYYEYNTYRGCLKLDSPNFSPAANIDDGNCEPAVSSTKFGGMYQTCEVLGDSTNGDICTAHNMLQRNPKTGDFTCPDGYQSVKIHSASLLTTRPNPRCVICRASIWDTDGFNWCCHDLQYDKYRLSVAVYSLYWCAATGDVEKHSGYLFGGLFTSDIANPLTQEKNCPRYFRSQQLGTDLHVCISSDYNLGAKYEVPFGGFFSCESGNPFADKTGHSNLPKGCPTGFSQHLAYVDQGCEINYCVKTGSLSSAGLPRIRRPPFIEPPDVDSAVKYMTLDQETQQWEKVEDSEVLADWPSGVENWIMTTGALVGICNGAMLLGCLVTFSITTCYWKRRLAGINKQSRQSRKRNPEAP